MKIISKSLALISKEERRRLNYLTLKGNSLMREDVLRAEDCYDEFQIFMAINEENKIIGWSVLFPEDLSTDCYDPSSDKHCLYTYVQTLYRRKGVGKLLVAAACDFAKEKDFVAQVFPWDARSEGFFEECADDFELTIVHEDFAGV